MQATVDQLRDDSDEKEQERERLESTVRELQAQISDLQEKLDLSKEDVARLQEELEEGQERERNQEELHQQAIDEAIADAEQRTTARIEAETVERIALIEAGVETRIAQVK